MKKKIVGLAVFLGVTALPILGAASVTQGVAASYGNSWFGSQPQGVQAFNIAYTLQPDSWNWKGFALGFNFSYGYWTTNSNKGNSDISTFAIAPVLRWYFLQNASVTPFIQASVGGAYLTSNDFGGRNLGSNFNFQDMAGVGLAFGQKKNLYLTLQALHYSNADLAPPNAGMTTLDLLSLGYNF